MSSIYNRFIRTILLYYAAVARSIVFNMFLGNLILICLVEIAIGGAQFGFVVSILGIKYHNNKY